MSSPVLKKPRLDCDSPTKENEADDDLMVIDSDDAKSVSSTPRTPRTPKTPRASSLKQQQLEEERERKRQEKEEEKRRKEQEREEERRRKEEIRRKKEEEKEEERRRKEEERRRKDEEREEERKKKEEERKRKEEEKRKELEAKREAKAKKEEEQLAIRLETERKKKEREEAAECRRRELEKKEDSARRQSNFFASFLVKLEKPEKQVLPPAVKDHPLFSPFEIKENMKVAPIHRRMPLSREEKNSLLDQTIEKSDYLSMIARKSWNFGERHPNRAKLFQFCTNTRPPYFGTYRQTSEVVTGRTPLRRDPRLNYEEDSDDEWEDDVEGDDCMSEEEDPEEVESQDEDDGFFVDHGYLSEGEGSDDEVAGEEDVEARKKRLAERAEEWKEERKKKERRKQAPGLEQHKFCPQSAPLDESHPEYEYLREHMLPVVMFTYTH